MEEPEPEPAEGAAGLIYGGGSPTGGEHDQRDGARAAEAERLKESGEDAFLRKDYAKAVSEFTQADELNPNDSELTAALEQARTLLAGTQPDSVMSSVQDGLVTDGMVVQTPPRLPQTPVNPEQELLRKEVEQVSDSVKKMQKDQERLASDVREALAQTMAQTESLRKALEAQLGALSAANTPARASDVPSPAPAPPAAAQPAADKVPKGKGEKAADAEAKKDDGERAAKKTKKKLKDKVKIVDVFDYTFNLCRDLASPERLGRDKRNYVKRLLYIVWPKRLVGGTGLTEDGLPDGSKEILATFVLALARTVVMNMSSDLLRQLQNAVYRRDSMWIFIRFLPYSALLTVLGSFMSSAMTYASEKLVITWRDQLTRRCHSHYFSMSSYYHIKNLPGRERIADPDERLAAEVTEVTKKLTMVIGLLFRGIPPIIWFTFRLWRERGLIYATLPHVYLLLAYEITSRIFPKNIGELYRGQAMVQGKYFKTVSRVQTHSEAIHALNGGAREHAIVNKKFEGVEGAATKLYKALSRFGLIFKVAYTYGCRSWIATAVMIPIISSGSSGSGTDRLAAEVGETRYGMDMMVEMLVANGTILTLHYVANQMAGQAGRIAKLIDTCEKLCEKRKAEKSGTFVDGDCIAFEGVDVHTPNGKLLVKELNFSLDIGGSLLLTGHNGAGKSSIFRCLGGLWNVPKGKITKPGGKAESLSESVFYLPQKPYNCNGSLSDQITYPESKDEVTREQLEDLLRRVDLSHLLLDSSAAADAAVNWEDKLSLGEQQRLAMARLFYHKPKFAILDECTSAVSLEMEAALYKECKSMSITYITICHRPALKAYHTHNLNLTGDGEGGWEYTEIDQSKVHARVATASSEGEDQLREKHLATRSEPYSHMEEVGAGDLKERSNTQKLIMLLKIAVPGSERKLALLIAGIIGRTLCHEAYSRVVGGLYNAVITRNIGKFVLFALINVAQDLFNGCVEEGVVLMQELVGIAWYQRLTKHCTERFFAGSNFYCVKNIDKRISDIDQRLTKEVVDLSKEFPKMFASAVTPVFDVLWFTGRMVSLLGLGGMIPFYLYIGATYAVSKFLMPNYEALFTKEQELESDYRFCQTRLRNHAESVAFFGGDEMEHKIATSFFEKLVDHQYIVRRKTAEFKFFFHCINKDFKSYSNNVSTPEIVTILMQMIYARRHALDSMADGTAGVLASSTFYVRSAVIRTVESFGQIFDLYETMAKLLGSGTRVCQMIDVLEDMSTDEDAIASSDSDEKEDTSTNNAGATDIVFKDVDIVTPLGQCLAKDLSVKVAPNTPLMVTGPNSVGKTSFFRALAGLWPVPKGTVLSPGAPNGVFLVPQRPYAVLGTLADQITYPAAIPKAERDEARLQACLEHVGIFYLVAQFEKEGGWDAEKTWEDVFSGGEMQRMGLARVFYHQPAFAVLDECTDAVSVDVEEGLYKSLQDEGVTTITISKRLALTDFHDAELQLYGIDVANAILPRPPPCAIERRCWRLDHGAPNARGWDYKALPHGESDEA